MATWTVTGRNMRGGRIYVTGTVAFSSMATSGEVVEASDILTGLDTLDYLRIAEDSGTTFQFNPIDTRSGRINAMDLSSSASFTTSSGSGLAFLAIGRAEV